MSAGTAVVVLTVLLVLSVVQSLVAAWRAQLRIQQVEAERDAAREQAAQIRQRATAGAALGQDDLWGPAATLPGEATGPTQEELDRIVEDWIRIAYTEGTGQ